MTLLDDFGMLSGAFGSTLDDLLAPLDDFGCTLERFGYTLDAFG